jgi:hypothetical protein
LPARRTYTPQTRMPGCARREPTGPRRAPNGSTAGTVFGSMRRGLPARSRAVAGNGAGEGRGTMTNSPEATARARAASPAYLLSTIKAWFADGSHSSLAQRAAGATFAIRLASAALVLGRGHRRIRAAVPGIQASARPASVRLGPGATPSALRNPGAQERVVAAALLPPGHVCFASLVGSWEDASAPIIAPARPARIGGRAACTTPHITPMIRK